MGHASVNRTVTVENGQNCLDICRQNYGTDEALVDFVNDNNYPSYDHIPTPGTKAYIRNPVPAYNNNNLNVVAYFVKNNIHIAGGIGFRNNRPVIVVNGNLLHTEEGQIITI